MPPRTSARGTRSAPGRPRRRMRVTCNRCGAEFECYISTQRKFCSRECYYGDPAWQDRTCQWCGKPFKVRDCYARRGGGQGSYCGNQCKNAARRGGLPLDATTGTCETCGKEFRFGKSSLDRGVRRRHCSKACSYRRATKDCATCGQTFEAARARTHAQFCSVACYRSSKAETSLERMVREEIEAAGLPYEQEVRMGRNSIDFVVAGWLAIEADGIYWHKGKNARPRATRRKDKKIAAAGYTLLRFEAPQDNPEDRARFKVALATAMRLRPKGGQSSLPLRLTDPLSPATTLKWRRITASSSARAG